MADNKKISKIKYPKGETVWQTYQNTSEEVKFIITSKPSRDAYFLYELIGDEFKKVGKAKTPTKLVETYDVKNKLLNV